MALAGTNPQFYFFWLLAILSIIYCIVGLNVFLQPHLFPTPNSTEYEAQSRLFMEAEGNVPVQHSTPRIYMLNLPRRTDRRERMTRLQAVTGLSWTFVDSTDSNTEVVTRIMERVRWIRAAAHLHAIDVNFHGWWSDHHDNTFEWMHASNGSESEPSSELWELARSDPASADHTHPLPIPTSLDQRPPLEVATSRIILSPSVTRDSSQALENNPLFNTNPNSVRTATRDTTNTLAPRLSELPSWRILTRAAIACWHSHISVIRKIASETIQPGTSDTGVLILEDDIDMEVDIQQRIGRLWEALPPDWDILFLGHCWSAEDTYPALRSHDQLHPSHSPKCTHAYALSRNGAQRLVQLLRVPSVAYGRPLDTAFLDLIQSNLVNAYSVHPSVIIQTKDTPSDIFPGNGSRWRDVLQMSALNSTGKLPSGRHFLCTSSLVVCPILGEYGLEPDCYSRNVMLGNYVLFQPAVLFVHILALGMTGIMILHIRSKYTAVGRKEILTFFYLYSIVELLAIFLDTQIIPTANNAYPWIAAIYTGLVAATYCCLLINGFIGFQFAEDGTPLSIWGLRGACFAMWGLTFFISICTFQGFAGFSPTKPIGLWVLHFIWPAICVVIYVVAQLVIVMRTLHDRWPLGDIVLGAAAFVVAQVILFGFGNTICTAVKHYIDGLFFYSLCILLGVMMVYKYWDSITGDDLEFSVGSKAGMWEIKDEPPAFGVNKYVDSSPSILPAPSPNGGTRQSLFPDQGDARTHSLIGGVSGQNAYVGSGYVGGGAR